METCLRIYQIAQHFIVDNLPQEEKGCHDSEGTLCRKFRMAADILGYT